MLEKNQGTPKTYLSDWNLFRNWLLDTKLNIEIQCLVTFGELFYEPLMQFFVTNDPIPHIQTVSGLIQLPPGRRAHKMPDKALEWLNFLQKIIEVRARHFAIKVNEAYFFRFLKELGDNFDIFFGQELLFALESLTTEEFDTLFNNLERGITKSYDYFAKWITPWMHLPLSVCRLGGNTGHSFAHAFYNAACKLPWLFEPTEIEIQFATQIDEDIKAGNSNTFGLLDNLKINPEFQQEFKNFCWAKNSELYDYPNLYTFAKEQIYFIMIHQQQVEGLFNKLDLKTHPNMTLNMKESKLQLSSGSIDKEDVVNNLKEIRTYRTKKNCTIAEKDIGLFGEDQAKEIFNNLFTNYT